MPEGFPFDRSGPAPCVNNSDCHSWFALWSRELSTILCKTSAIYCPDKVNFLRGRFFIMTANAVETLAPSKADFKSLEEKVLRTIELLKSAREAKAAAERDAARLRHRPMSAKNGPTPIPRSLSGCAASAKRYVPE